MEPADVRAEIEKVRRLIGEAFSSLPIPAEGNLLGPSQGDPAGEAKVRRDLAGRPWQEVDKAYMKKRWSSFVYLGAEGYRYYLPSLLTAALSPFGKDLTHSAFFSLVPSFWELYYNRRDIRFELQTSLLDEVQYQAVCAFLGLGFIGSEQYLGLAAEALRWGWNRWDSPAGTKSREYYHRMFHFEYPEPADPEARAAVAQIRAAFAETPYPGDYELCGSSLGDEPAGYALEFQGSDWRGIHPEFLSYNHAALSFLSHAGLRYFLPAFLISSLTERETGVDSNASPIFHLTHHFCQPPDRSDFGYGVARFSQYSTEERAAIVSYLKYAGADEFARPEIDQALARYWSLPSPPLPPSIQT